MLTTTPEGATELSVKNDSEPVQSTQTPYLYSYRSEIERREESCFMCYLCMNRSTLR